MFDIKIGTCISVPYALSIVKAVKDFGFEGYSVSTQSSMNAAAYPELAKALRGEGAVISSLGAYGNPLAEEDTVHQIERCIDSAEAFGCNFVGVFAGRTPGESVEGSIPAFRRVFGELARRAEDKGVRIGFEGCGGGWNGGNGNIAYCPDAWTLMFDAVPSDALGLEWEPAHAIERFMDPVAQLRRWVKKVYHVHAKDGTVAWDVVREHGVDSPHRFMWDRTPGFGDTNWNDLFTILLMNGYKGYADIEGYHDPVHYDNVEWSAQLRSLKYLKDCRGGQVFVEGPEYKGFQPPKEG